MSEKSPIRITTEQLSQLQKDFRDANDTAYGIIDGMDMAIQSNNIINVTVSIYLGGVIEFEVAYDRPQPVHINDYTKPLTPAMDNVLASRLGDIAIDAGNRGRRDVGDSIDRGLILRRLLEEQGFYVVVKNNNPFI